jgi:AcrR family transcriptional regulator
MPISTPAQELNATAEQLLKAAEKLLAERGLGAVSTREIARQAGQKNHSALNYHFGSRESLIDAILDYRMGPLNDRRSQQLAALRAAGREDDLRSLVEVVVLPIAEVLLLPANESYYLRLMAQLMSQHEWQSLFTANKHRASAVLEAGELLLALLQQSLSKEIALERLRLMGMHSLNTITEWDAMRRRNELTLNTKNLQWRVSNLVDYLVGALQASCHQPSNRKLQS